MYEARDEYLRWTLLFWAISAACFGTCGWGLCTLFGDDGTSAAATIVVVAGLAAVGFLLAAVMATTVALAEHVSRTRSLVRRSRPRGF